MTNKPITLIICYQQLYYYASATSRNDSKKNKVSFLILGKVIWDNNLKEVFI